MSVDLANCRCRTIGVSSCMPGEGKSTVAANLAHLMALSGAKVLLVDADLRNPMLTLTLTPDAERGLIDAANNPTILADVVWTFRSSLEFLPGRAFHRAKDSYEALVNERMQRLLTKLTDNYHYVVLDLPPLAPLVDVRAATSFIDGIVLVTKWGSTSASVVKKVVEASGSLKDKLLGAVLNRVDVKKLKQYESLDDAFYYNKYYVSYKHAKERGC
jgi:succinoglycan biosynthesis transport protein ExoP